MPATALAELSGDNDHDRDCKGILNLRLCLQFRNKPLTKYQANFKDFPEFNLGFWELTLNTKPLLSINVGTTESESKQPVQQKAMYD